jgi:hypothetical protein
MFKVEVMAFEKAAKYLVGLIILINTKRKIMSVFLGVLPYGRRRMKVLFVFPITVLQTSQTFTGCSAASS